MEDIFNEFYRSAYVCLGSVLIKTQKKASVFVKFMLSCNKQKKEVLFENLINKGFNFKFTVETNFSIENLHKIYKSSGLEEVGDDKMVKRNDFLARLAEDSLFT